MREKDPEGLYGQPQTGHLARREMKRRFEKDAEFREELEQQAREEKQRRQALRQVIIQLINRCYCKYSLLFCIFVIFVWCVDVGLV